MHVLICRATEDSSWQTGNHFTCNDLGAALGLSGG